MSQVEQIADNILVLTDIVPVDGRVSWLPPGAGGYEPYNEYLLLSPDRALLIETGVALHGPSLIPTLKEIVGSRRLAVLPMRIELDSLGNLGRILEEFPGAVVGSANPVSPVGLVHLSDWTTPKSPLTIFGLGRTLAEFGFPGLRMVEAVIRTLGTVWLHDEATDILFTTDFFCSDLLPSPNDSVMRRSGEPLVPAEGLRASILQKFDWLEVADTRALLKSWDTLFTNIKPSALAPVHGRIQVGHDLVQGVIEDYRTALFFSEKGNRPALVNANDIRAGVN